MQRSAGYWDLLWPRASASTWERWAAAPHTFLPNHGNKVVYAVSVTALWRSAAVCRWFTSSPTSIRRMWSTACVWRTVTHRHRLRMHSGSADLPCRKLLCPREWKRFVFCLHSCTWSELDLSQTENMVLQQQSTCPVYHLFLQCIQKLSLKPLSEQQ